MKDYKMVKPTGMPIGQLILLNEKHFDIEQEGDELKPYLHFSNCFLKNKSYLIPIIDQFNEDGIKKENPNWIEIKSSTPSILKLDDVKEVPIFKLIKAFKSENAKKLNKIDKSKFIEIEEKFKSFNK